MNYPRFIGSFRPWGLLLLVTAVTWCHGDTPAPPKPSAYAPAKDLAAQVERLIQQIDSELADAAEYQEEQQDRVAKDANTLIAVAQVAANHDEDHAIRKAAAALVAASRKLADAADDFAAAKAALAGIKEASRSSASGSVPWEPQADLAQLMKQVPIVNNRLRSGVTGKRFDRTLEQNAGLATTLAAIAHVSQFDKAYCASKEEESVWVRICAEMRDAAAEVQVAVRKKDQAAAKTALDKLVQTCDTCHLDFRD